MMSCHYIVRRHIGSRALAGAVSPATGAAALPVKKAWTAPHVGNERDAWDPYRDGCPSSFQNETFLYSRVSRIIRPYMRMSPFLDVMSIGELLLI